MIDGVDRKMASQAVLSKHPVLGLAQLCKDQGTFNPMYYWELYQKICGVTMDLAKQLFKVPSQEFYTPENIATLLDIHVDPKDTELYTNWRVFLKLTEGIPRSAINKAFKTKDPMAAVLKLCESNDQFSTKECMALNDKAIKSIVELAKNMFPDESDDFYDPVHLANEFDVSIDGASMTAFEKKRLFMKLTQGIRLNELKEALLSDDHIEKLGDLARNRGTLIKPAIQPMETIVEETIDQDEQTDHYSSFSTYFNSKKRNRSQTGNSPVNKRQKILK